MKTFYLITILFTVFAFAQDSKPNWIDESWRSANYPALEWYVGFAEDNVREQVNSGTYLSIERKAQNKLSESIRIKIQSFTNLQSKNKQIQNNNDFKEIISSNYKQDVKTQTDNILVGLESKSWFDKKNNTIYGFAAVKKKDLANFYRSKITAIFSFAEKELFIAEQLAETDKKKLALEKIQTVEDSLKNISYWGSLLQVVEIDNSYLDKEKNLLLTINNVKIQLQNSTTIYLEVYHNEQYSELNERLAAQMQEKGCNCTITKSKENANYLVTVKTKLSNCNINKKNYGFIYCYANASATVNNPKYQKPININVDAKGGWANNNKDKAIQETFKDIANSLAKKINQTINQ